MDPWGWALVLVFIATIGIFIWADGGYFSGFEQAILGSLTGCFTVLISVCVLFGVALYTESSSTQVEQHTVGLKSMGDTSEIHGKSVGSLFVSTGYINQDAVFRFYGENDNGSYTLATVTAGNSEVREGDYGQPYADCYWEPVKDVPKIRGWFFGIDEDTWQNADDARWCTFYVPDGSIAEDYTLDTE